MGHLRQLLLYPANFFTFHFLHPPSSLESIVDLEVEDAEAAEGNDASDDELGEVVVPEDVVVVHTEIRGDHVHLGDVLRNGLIRL